MKTKEIQGKTGERTAIYNEQNVEEIQAQGHTDIITSLIWATCITICVFLIARIFYK